MYNRKHNTEFDRRDEVVLTVVAVLVPLLTLPALLGF